MKKQAAEKLHNGDEVTIKNEGAITTVLSVYENPESPRYIMIECADGNTYYHDEIS